jgi:FlaA1/EpsC-like NDP-sugar epimerase
LTRDSRLGAGPNPSTRLTSPRIVADAVAWLVALALGFLLGGLPRDSVVSWSALAALGGVVLASHLVGAAMFSLYATRTGVGRREIRALLLTVLLVAVVVAAATLATPAAWRLDPASVAISALIALLLMSGIRYVARTDVAPASGIADSAQPTLVYGAGWLGRHLVGVMREDRASPYRPVGFIDDDETLLGQRVDGVEVMGAIDDLRGIAQRTGATSIVVSIARADGSLLRRVSGLGAELGLRVLVFPSLEEILEGKSQLRDVRDIAIEDLIGRQPVNTDVESMAGYLRGKRILVTGAGGSIGSELCRQISRYAPEELIMLDRDETGLQGTQLLLEGHGLLMNNNIVLADIRDEAALDRVFRERRPSVVFHAAALKHLPMLERFPAEAWKTNVIGTLNVLRAARSVDVETFVNISTDKAANATSVLGHSKRLAERLTAWAAGESGRTYLSVRFGNVLGSRGSLVPVFASMIEAGGPLTVTDRDVTRFFMSIPEACHLVVQAGGIGSPGEVLILDMGEPVRIIDIAERMIARSGKDIPIVITGLREGEKLHEELVSDGEQTHRPVHPKISHSSVAALSPGELDEAAWNRHFEKRNR